MDEEHQTQDSYATYIFNEWRNILILSEKVRTNFFYFFDVEKADKIEDFKASNDEKDDLYIYISKIVGTYSSLYPKVISRPDFGKFTDEYKAYERYYHSPWLLLEEVKSGNESTSEMYTRLSKMEAIIGKALEKLKLITFEG